ncbi:glycoside hydrolase superfamily [Dipodascopsis uninucleata]
MTKDSIQVSFLPSIGQSTFTHREKFTVYAVANNPSVSVNAVLRDGETVAFTPTAVKASQEGFYTFSADVTVGNEPLELKYSYSFDGAKITLGGSTTIYPQRSRQESEQFCTSIDLEPGEGNATVKIAWLNSVNWQGWAFQRVRETWIEPRWTKLHELHPELVTHFLLLQPLSADIDPSSTLAVFPCSTTGAFVTLSGGKDEYDSAVYAHVQRATSEGKVTVHVCGTIATNANVYESIDGVIELAKSKIGTSNVKFYYPDLYENGKITPFNQIGFCTWSSIGEHVPITYKNFNLALDSLKSTGIPLGTFIIDDGWQDIRAGPNNEFYIRGLYGFDTRDDLGCSLEKMVSLVKEKLPTVINVGVWMTLYGYWNAITPSSPLVEKYHMKKYRLDKAKVGGLLKEFGNNPCETLYDPDDTRHIWWLPPKEFALDYYTDYFKHCKESGVSFIKVDNQAYGSFLEGTEGSEEFRALWDNMLKAAENIFGTAHVIHCMAHYERTFSGDIGLGSATQGRRVVLRNTDDFGLPKPNIHRDHIHYNLMNGILTSRLCFIPDADMFMTSAQWPEYHAVLRSYFPGPVLLSDKAGEHDLNVINKLIGKTPSGQYDLVKALNTAQPLSSRLWEPSFTDGTGPSIKASSYFPEAASSALILWSSRNDASYPSVDVLLSTDVTDALSGHAVSGGNYVLWCSQSQVAVFCDDPVNSIPFPLIQTTLNPSEFEAITISPFHMVANESEIACLGLIDKYASLGAIKDVKVEGAVFSTNILFEGLLCFIVRGCNDIHIKIDDRIVDFEKVHINSTAFLLKTEVKAYGEANNGRDSWYVEVFVSEQI